MTPGYWYRLCVVSLLYAIARGAANVKTSVAVAFNFGICSVTPPAVCAGTITLCATADLTAEASTGTCKTFKADDPVANDEATSFIYSNAEIAGVLMDIPGSYKFSVRQDVTVAGVETKGTEETRTVNISNTDTITTSTVVNNPAIGNYFIDVKSSVTCANGFLGTTCNIAPPTTTAATTTPATTTKTGTPATAAATTTSPDSSDTSQEASVVNAQNDDVISDSSSKNNVVAGGKNSDNDDDGDDDDDDDDEDDDDNNTTKDGDDTSSKT